MKRDRVVMTNKTWWRDDDLMKLVTAGLKHEGVYDSDGSLYFVNFYYGRRSHGRNGFVGGYGRHGGRSLDLCPPKHFDGKAVDEMPAATVKEVARVLVHEIGHNLGLGHGEMADWWEIEVPWVEGLRIRRKAQAKKPTTEQRVEKRARNVDAKVVEIEGKLALMKTREKKLRKRLTAWRRKQRYYRKAAALAGSKAGR